MGAYVLGWGEVYGCEFAEEVKVKQREYVTEPGSWAVSWGFDGAALRPGFVGQPWVIRAQSKSRSWEWVRVASFNTKRECQDAYRAILRERAKVQ